VIEQTKAAVSYEAAAFLVYWEPVFLFAPILEKENTRCSLFRLKTKYQPKRIEIHI